MMRYKMLSMTQNYVLKQLTFFKVLHQYSISRSYEYDIVIVGGGIIGTAVAKTIKERQKNTKIALLEKEHDLAQHQSSHNSQVLHAGFYYRPNTLKAKLCVEGSKLIYRYCETNNIPVSRNGKLVIGQDALDKLRLKELCRRGLQNKVSGLELLEDWNRVKEIQANCRGICALWSPNTGNIDWEVVTKHFGQDFKKAGGDIFLNSYVKYIDESDKTTHPVVIFDSSNNRIFFAKYAVLCQGLEGGSLGYSSTSYKNISLKVVYHLLNPKLHRFIKTNIYAMPDIDLPFIGVHISPTVDGKVFLGPSAIPASALSGQKQSKIDLRYLRKHVLSKDFGLLFVNNFSTCLKQVMQTISSDARTHALKLYFPMITNNDIQTGPTAIQGQLVTNDGEFVDDFIIETFDGCGIQKRIINCRFIPSPGATASLAIGEMINNEIASKLTIS